MHHPYSAPIRRLLDRMQLSACLTIGLAAAVALGGLAFLIDPVTPAKPADVPVMALRGSLPSAGPVAQGLE